MTASVLHFSTPHNNIFCIRLSLAHRHTETHGIRQITNRFVVTVVVECLSISFCDERIYWTHFDAIGVRYSYTPIRWCLFILFRESFTWRMATCFLLECAVLSAVAVHATHTHYVLVHSVRTMYVVRDNNNRRVKILRLNWSIVTIVPCSLLLLLLLLLSS